MDTDQKIRPIRFIRGFPLPRFILEKPGLSRIKVDEPMSTRGAVPLFVGSST